jgi:hypothetical protein
MDAWRICPDDVAGLGECEGMKIQLLSFRAEEIEPPQMHYVVAV